MSAITLPGVTAVARDKNTIYFGRIDGLIARVDPSGPAMPIGSMGTRVQQIVAHGDRLLAFGDNPDGGEQLLAWSDTAPNSKFHSCATDVKLLLSPEFYIDETPAICDNRSNEIVPFMSIEILDSEPFVYDHTYVGGKQLLAIARMGTIYTIDLSVKPKAPLAFSFDGSPMATVNDMMESDDTEEADSDVATISVATDDFEEREAKAFEMFDRLIDPAFPIRAHHPQCYTYFIKILERPGRNPIVISSAGDHHITVHDFYTHETLLDTDWIDPLCFCGTVVGNKAILGGRNADIVVIDLDTMKWEATNLGVDLTLHESRSSDSRVAFRTTDNSILLVDPVSLKIIDAIPCDGKIAGFDITARGLFVLNTDGVLTAHF